jgi:DNA repair exonuclease SbcCD ATPase subunit
LSDPEALQAGLEARIAETEQQINPFRERLAVIEELMEQNRNELDRALELYLSDQFPKEMLMSRKNELETAIQSLEHEKSKLIKIINDQTLSPQQIESIYEFASKIGGTLDEADQDFRQRRTIVDALDVRVVITVEDNKKVVYAECALDSGRFEIEQAKKPGGGNSSGKRVRNMSVENYANCRRKNPRRENQDAAAAVPPRARRQ